MSGETLFGFKEAIEVSFLIIKQIVLHQQHIAMSNILFTNVYQGRVAQLDSYCDCK